MIASVLKRSVAKQALMLLKSLVIIGAILGLTIGIIGMSVPWLLPNLYNSDPKVIQEVIW